jgi:hypothetical protein
MVYRPAGLGIVARQTVILIRRHDKRQYAEDQGQQDQNGTKFTHSPILLDFRRCSGWQRPRSAGFAKNRYRLTDTKIRPTGWLTRKPAGKFI